MIVVRCMLLVVRSQRTLPLPAESPEQHRERRVAELTRLLTQLPPYMQRAVQQLSQQQKQQFLGLTGDQLKAYFQRLEREHQQEQLRQQGMAGAAAGGMGGQPAAWHGQATSPAAAALTRCANPPTPLSLLSA
jgi:hypothetical protein